MADDDRCAAAAERRSRFASSFSLDSVAAAYRFRPPYPSALLDFVATMATGTPRRLLDLGAGDGSVARPMLGRVDAVDAVEPSAAMVAIGRQSPGGDDPRLTWQVEPAESFTCEGPYGLATVGAALHWFDLPAVAARLRRVLLPEAVVAVLDRSADRPDVQQAVAPLFRRHSRNQDYDPSYSAAQDMAEQGLWRITGTYATEPVPFAQSVDAYIEAVHSTSTLARDLMTPAEAVEFDAALRDAVAPFADDAGMLRLELTGSVTWGAITR